MANFNLPPVSEKAYPPLSHFPTRMQALIFRMWDTVPREKLAEVLETTAENIDEAAFAMGLLPQGDCTLWQKRGYISIIKNAWHILPYEQICALLDWTEEKLAFILREDDFLGCKLGDEKPFCEKLIYRPLTDEEKEKTKKIKAVTEKYIKVSEKKPFDFFTAEDSEIISKKAKKSGFLEITEEWGMEDLTKKAETAYFRKLFEDDFHKMFAFPLKGGKKKIKLVLSDNLLYKGEYHEIDCTEEEITITAFSPVGILRGLMHLEDYMLIQGGPYVKIGKESFREKIKTRYIYSFCGLYSNAFEEDVRTSYPDELLRRYARSHINGVFTQGVLYKLTPFEFDPDISKGWEKQLDGVKRTVEHLKKYGIKLYLYINEPRAMSLAFFEKYPHLKGRVMGDYASMCTSAPEVKEYLYNAVKRLCGEVPDIGGFFLITCSENLTNCYSHIRYGEKQPCPRCEQRKNYEVIAEVCNIVNRAAKSVNKDITTFANTWQWLNAFSAEETEKCIELLDKDIPLLCTSEEGLRFNCGGKEHTLQDYSISKVGPSTLSMRNWKTARESGNETAAKVQINTTWECSTVPFMPTFELVKKHMENLDRLNTEHLMLSWTLGGYPSDTLKIVSDFYFERDGELQSDKTLDALYGDDATKIKEASKLFCAAFEKFPFDVGTVYTGPHNAGVSNLLYEKPTGLKATMTCFCYDDLEAWRSVYTEDIYEKQLTELLKKWEEGIEILEGVKECDFTYMAKACLAIFSSCVNQVRFIRMRDNDGIQKDKEALKELLKSETENAKMLYNIMQKCPAIGYEAANHYYYTQAMMLEKILNCAYLEEKLCK